MFVWVDPVSDPANRELSGTVSPRPAALALMGKTQLDRSEPNLIELRALLKNMVSDARRAAEIIARIRAMAKRWKSSAPTA